MLRSFNKRYYHFLFDFYDMKQGQTFLVLKFRRSGRKSFLFLGSLSDFFSEVSKLILHLMQQKCCGVIV